MSSSPFRRVARHVAVPIGLVAAFTLGGSVAGSSSPAPSPEAAPLAAPLPDYVPGAVILNIGIADAQPFGTVAGVTLVSSYSPIASTYSTSGAVVAPLDLPAGAKIVQIDVYGYHPAGGSATWYLTNWFPAVAEEIAVDSVDVSGTGVVHGVIDPDLYWTGTYTTQQTKALWVYASEAQRFVGAVVQYTLPTNALGPVTPFRVFDTRLCGGVCVKVAQGTPRTFNVKDSIDVVTGAVLGTDVVPVGTVAVAYNLTVTQTEGAGYIAILPGGTTTVTASAINWTSSGVTIANGGIVVFGSGANERKVTLVCGGAGGARAHVILDITGFFFSEAA